MFDFGAVDCGGGECGGGGSAGGAGGAGGGGDCGGIDFSGGYGGGGDFGGGSSGGGEFGGGEFIGADGQMITYINDIPVGTFNNFGESGDGDACGLFLKLFLLTTATCSGLLITYFYYGKD